MIIINTIPLFLIIIDAVPLFLKLLISPHSFSSSAELSSGVEFLAKLSSWAESLKLDSS